MKYLIIVLLISIAVPASLPACTAERTVFPSSPAVSPSNTTAISPASTSARPSPSDMVPRITVEELYKKMQGNADVLIIDARAGVETEFDKDHIKGAISAPLSKFTEGWAPDVPLNKEIVIYCT